MRAPFLPRGGAPSAVRLPLEAAEVVRAALSRRPHGAAVVVFADDEVRVDERDALVQHYRRTGVRELVVQLRSAVVPPGKVLGLVDLEVGARVVLLDVGELLALAGDDEQRRPAVLAVGGGR